MKILHISDLHYVGSHNVLDKLSEHIEREEIDLCLFTGDLVDKNSKSLSEAYSILKEFNEKIKSKNFFITCGNHDIDRIYIKDSFKNIIKTFKNESDINSFVKEDKAEDFSSNLSHIKNYKDLLSKEYSKSVLSDLYAIHNFNYENKKIAVVDLNFSWSTFNEKNINDIIFPSYIIQQISRSIEKYDLKILITHYPLDFLNVKCRRIISDIIHKNFDCHFTGHSHEQELSYCQYSDSGMFTSISATTMDDNDNDHIGYCLLDLDIKLFKISVYNNFWRNNKFIKEPYFEIDIPTNTVKKNEIELSKSIDSKLSTIIERSNRLFVPTFEKDKITFTEMYTKQNIKTKNLDEQYSIESHDKINHKSKDVSFNDFYGDNNYLIYGKEKSGKSVLLHKLMIDFLKNFSQNRIIPIYIDMKDSPKNINFKREISKFIQEQYNISSSFINKIITNLKLKLLIDNFNYNDGDININNDLYDFINRTSNCSFIITSTYFFNTNIFNLGDLQYNTVYIHDISRTNMRELTNKWPIEKKFDKNEILKKMITIFSQLNIHFNYWTVSMFLCIIEKTNDVRLHNNSELIDLYVENLLDKQGLSSKSKKTFSYDNLRMFLAILAHYFYTCKSENNYTAKYSDIVNCYEEYKKNNLRVVANVTDIIQYLIEKGIIYDISGEFYTFRLNAIFEYFLAYYMLKDDKFKYEVINDSKTYLKFKNELEIYSGLKKDDFIFLLQIFFNTEEALNLLLRKHENIDYEEKIKEDNKDVKKILEFAHEIRNEIEPISLDTQDLIYDEIKPISDIDSSIQIKREYNIDDINSNLYAEHLSVLGRVFRNIDDIDKKDENCVKIIFRFLINQYCLTTYYSIQEFTEYLIKNDKIKMIKEISMLFRTFSPLLAHTFLFENVSHPTLSKIIQEEINFLKEKSDDNQFKLFVLYFLLIESNIEEMHTKIKEIIDISKHWNIQQSIFIKLLLLISFKCDKNPKLSKVLKQYVEEIHKKIHKSKSNKGVVNEILHKIDLNEKNWLKGEEII